jgi:alkylated DNA nucleotide flippase Atl1
VSTARPAIYRVVGRIPFGHVLSYGDVGKIVGVGPRQVATAMRGCPPGLPWYRVVGSGGVIRTRGATASIQKQSLIAEGIRLRGARFSYSSHRWQGTS